MEVHERGAALRRKRVNEGAAREALGIFIIALVRSRILRKMLFPVQGLGDNLIQIVVLRAPSKGCVDLVCCGDKCSRVTITARHVADIEIDGGCVLYCFDDLFDRIALPVTAIEDIRPTTISQIAQRRQVSGGEIADMDVVADAGAIRGVIVNSENIQMAAFAERCLAGNFDQVGCPGCRLT